MSNFQRILIVITLSVAVILISGILLPKYLSSQILELRKELNSQNSKPKYTLQANLVPVAENHIQNESDFILSQNPEAGEHHSLLNNSIPYPTRVRKRSKRQTDPDEHFNWKINFNLTRKRNNAVQGSPDIASSTSKKDKYLDIAIFTEGEAKRKSAFAEIQHHLRVFEYFFKYLLSSENFTQEEIEGEHSRSGVDFENFGSGDDASLKRREGKFFNLGSFNIFGFGRSPEKISTTVSTISETDSPFRINDLTTQSPSNVIIENPKEMPNFQAHSLVSEMLNVVNASSTFNSNLPGKTEDGECTDCNKADIQLPITSEIEEKAKSDQTEIKSSIEFTDEFLEMFCMSLVNKVGVSQHLSDSEDLIPKQSIADEHTLKPSKNTNLDLLPIYDYSEQNPEFLDENSATTNTMSEKEKRQKKFINLVSMLGFGSGRSADESNELPKDKFADVVDLENLPTLVDCENHFRKKNLKMFPKPNLMDILRDPNIKFADLANATISSKLIEQQLEFLTDLLKTNLDSSGETFGKNSELFTKPISDEISENDITNAIPKEMLSNDLDENLKALITSTDTSIAQQTTDFERDGRFFGNFGFGSGNLESRSLEHLNENEAIGSGDMRSLDELGSGDFKAIPKEMLGNDLDENIKAIITNTDTSIAQQKTDFERDGRFFGNFGFGSGNLESRSLEHLNKNEVIGSGDMRSLNAASLIIRTNELGSGDSNAILKEMLANDFDGHIKALTTSTDTRIAQQTTDFERDGRFFGIFGFGSGNLESRSLEHLNKNEVIGSGDMRSLDAASFITSTNELGSVDSRSLRAVLFGNRDELGSGNLRSLETAPAFEDERDDFGSGEFRFQGAAIASGINGEEFGSGDSRTLGFQSSTTFRNEFGSDDSRSQETAVKTEINQFGSGEFKSLDVTSEIEVEFGSGDFRSLENAESKVREGLGSGDFRSVKDLSSEIDRKEFGSGDFSLLQDTTSEIEGKDIGSGDFRPLEVSTSGTEGREFGSGDFRSPDDTTSNTQGNNIGSGDFRSFDGSTLKIKGKEIASGEFRSLVDETSGNEGKEFGSGYFKSLENGTSEIQGKFGSGDFDSFADGNTPEIEKKIGSGDFRSVEDTSRENGFGSGDSFNEMDLYEESQSLSPNKQRFWGSGNNSNKNTATVNLDSSEAQNVIEGTPEQSTEKSMERFLGPIFLTGSGDGELFGDSEGPINLLEEESISVDTGNDSLDKMNSKKQNVSEKSLEETNNNTRRFLGPIFLTGSGDGGLFEDSGGPINLLEEEESKVKSRNSSLRRARLDDIPLNISEVLDESSVKLSAHIDRLVDGNKTKFTSPVTPSKRSRLEDSTDVICDDCDYEDFVENYRKKQSLGSNKNVSKFEKRKNMESDSIPLNNENTTSVTVFPGVIRSNDKVLPELSKSRFQTRPCTAARECNVTLNERCISINSSRVCGCSKGYARNKQTSKCTVKKIVETSLKLPGEHFNEDLNNPFSESFQQKRKSSIELAIRLLQSDPELLQFLSEIDVVKFSSGSLIVTLNLVFAVENESEEQLVKHVEDNINVALQNEALIKSVSLDISNAALLSVSGEIDYCKSSELNYCSENAYCVSNPALPASYSCHCKEHYRDVSLNPRHIGEACISKCPKEYCGLYGHCELLPNDEKVCLCSGLYFGRRCEVPGLYVLIALAFVGFVSLTMLILVVLKRRCSRFTYSEAQAQRSENGMNSHVNGRVSDAIALEENIGTTKFITISTPIPHPAINIIRPTVTESGSSYEFDSTFDSTPSTQKAEENSTV